MSVVQFISRFFLQFVLIIFNKGYNYSGYLFPLSVAVSMVSSVTAVTVLHEAQVAALRETMALLRAQLDDVRVDRDAWKAMSERLALPKLDAPAKPARPSFWRWVGGAG